MEKFSEMGFRQGMEIWKGQAHVGGIHLSEDQLTLATSPGGLSGADEYLVEHLASCPLCLEKWAAACRRARHHEPVSAPADDWYSGGLLEAAASSESGAPVALTSRCGNFTLRIFPNEKSSGGMVALETRNPSARERSEGKMVTVQDAVGKIIIEGKIISGRVARMVDNLARLDLQVWSLMIKRG